MYTVVVTTEGNDEDDGGVVVGTTRELWSRDGNEREIESPGREIGGGVAAGIERVGGVLESYSSSPKYQKSALQYSRIRTSKNKNHSRLNTKPLARAARTREEAITLDNMIFRKRS